MSSWSWAHLKTLLGFKKEYTKEDYIAVMWPVAYPLDYPAPKDPHITIIMLGTTDTANFTKDEVLDAMKETNYNAMPYVSVSGLEWFGPDNDVPVLTVKHSFLFDYKKHLERRLAERGIFNTSSYPDYRPHITITEDAATGNNYPLKLVLGPVELWWGTEHIRID